MKSVSGDMKSAKLKALGDLKAELKGMLSEHLGKKKVPPPAAEKMEEKVEEPDEDDSPDSELLEKLEKMHND